jgi:hypothetical protein
VELRLSRISGDRSGKSRFVTTDECVWGSSRGLLPPELKARFDAWYEAERLGREPENVNEHPGMLPSSEAWNRLVTNICGRWWSDERFPNWLWARHPAAPLVSACIVWDPRLVDAELVTDLDPSPHSLDFDPQYPSGHAAQRASNEAWRVLLDTVDSLFSDRQSLTPADFQWAVRQAQSAAIGIWREATASGELFSDRYWVVPIYPGMSGEDWRKIAARALDVARAKEDHIRNLAIEMLALGHSETEVANEFGYSRPTIAGLARRARRVGKLAANSDAESR